MSKLIGLIGGLLLYGSVAAVELFLPLPSYIRGGIPALEIWLEAKKPDVFTFAEKVQLDSTGSLFAVYHSVGSGAYVLDAYIYGCNEANCSLIGMRTGIAGLSYDKGQPLMMKFSKGRGEVRVVDAKGKVYLLISDLR